MNASIYWLIEQMIELAYDHYIISTVWLALVAGAVAAARLVTVDRNVTIHRCTHEGPTDGNHKGN